MDSCNYCKYWSDRVAESIGGGPLVALCLNTNSPQHGRMVRDGCEEFERGRPIDDPATELSEHPALESYELPARQGALIPPGYHAQPGCHSCQAVIKLQPPDGGPQYYCGQVATPQPVAPERYDESLYEAYLDARDDWEDKFAVEAYGICDQYQSGELNA